MTTAIPAAAPSTHDTFERAFERVLPEAEALDPRELRVLNVEIEFATGMVLGSMGPLRTLLPALSQLYGFDAARVDALERSALALVHAHALFSAKNRRFQLLSLRAEAIALRDQLKVDARALLQHSLLPSTPLDNLANTTGDRALAADLLSLRLAFLEDPASHAGHTAVTPAHLARAAAIASQLLCAVGERAASRSKVVAALAEQRQRLFTLFILHYNEVRWAVDFLRRNHGDADKFLPSLRDTYAPRRARSAPETATPAPAASPSTEEAAQPAPAASQPEAPAEIREGASLFEQRAKPGPRQGARHRGRGSAKARPAGLLSKAPTPTLFAQPAQPPLREGAGHETETHTTRRNR